MSGVNQLCTRHLRGVTDLDECIVVAKRMGYEFVDLRDREMMPPGCYFLNENKKVYFNTHVKYPYGRNSIHAEQICKSKG